jgi:hypothetical protein
MSSRTRSRPEHRLSRWPQRASCPRSCAPAATSCSTTSSTLLEPAVRAGARPPSWEVVGVSANALAPASWRQSCRPSHPPVRSTVPPAAGAHHPGARRLLHRLPPDRPSDPQRSGLNSAGWNSRARRDTGADARPRSPRGGMRPRHRLRLRRLPTGRRTRRQPGRPLPDALLGVSRTRAVPTDTRDDRAQAGHARRIQRDALLGTSANRRRQPPM